MRDSPVYRLLGYLYACIAITGLLMFALRKNKDKKWDLKLFKNVFWSFWKLLSFLRNKILNYSKIIFICYKTVSVLRVLIFNKYLNSRIKKLVLLKWPWHVKTPPPTVNRNLVLGGRRSSGTFSF